MSNETNPTAADSNEDTSTRTLSAVETARQLTGERDIAGNTVISLGLLAVPTICAPPQA